MDNDARPDIHRKWIQSRLTQSEIASGRVNSKAGIVSASSGVGQAVQGVGSALLPGDMSNVRSPVRSGLWSAVTPGGLRKPSIRRAVTQEREYRCPEGYQFGGRFTDSKWSTCGRQLFDLPTIFPSLLRIAENAARAEAGMEVAPSVGRTLRGQETGGSVIQSRAAQIPRVGPMSRKSRNDNTSQAIKSLVSNSSVPYMMIRRDGFPMMPVVSVAELRKVPDNRNMEDAVFLMQASSIDMLGKDELGLLSNTGITSLVYVFPNGSTIRMDRTRKLTVGERRKLGKTVSAASNIDNSKNPLARLDSVLSESGDAISLTTDFIGVNSDDEVIESGKNRGLPRWAVESFKPAEGRSAGQAITPNSQSEEDERRENLSPSKKIKDIETAIEHINRGGNLSDIDPMILMEAVKRSRMYRQKRTGNNQTLFTRRDEGVSFVLTDKPLKFEGLSSHISAEISEHLGLPSPRIRLAGEGPERPYLTEYGPTISPDNEVDYNIRINSLPGTDVATLAIADYLTDVRNRNPSSVIGAQSQNRMRASSSTYAPSSLVGLSADEIKRRYALSLPEYLRSDNSSLLRDIRRRNEAVRRQILAIYESLLQRARQFDWDNYLARIKADGNLSKTEMRHLEIVRGLFEQRLSSLSKAKTEFSELLELEDE